MAVTDRPEPGRPKRALEEFALRSRTIARQAWLDEAAVGASEALSADGIEARLLKGIVLSRVLYREGESRGYYDIDVLVSPADIDHAGRVLERLGYQDVSKLDGVVDVAGVLHARVFTKSVVGYGNVTIDLHWRLAGCAVPSEVVWEMLSRNPAQIEVQGAALPSLSQCGLALHLALHAAQNGARDMKSLGDLERGVERWPVAVWVEAAELARGLQALDAFAAGLRLLPEGARMADTVLALPSADALLWEIRNRDRRPRGTYHLRAIREAHTLRERLVILRAALLPSRVWIREQYRWARRGGMPLALAYLAHVARSPLWALRAWWYRARVKRLERRP
jgi:Uncharacterised nucleotidyltransferase